MGFWDLLLPSGGYTEFATVSPFLIASIFENAGIPCDTLKLVNSLQNRDIFGKCVTENAIGTVMLTQDNVYLLTGNKKETRISQSLFAGLIVRIIK